MKPIPVSAAKQIGEAHGFDQVVIYARKVGDEGGEHMTTWGSTPEHCGVVGRIGNALKQHIMGWGILDGVPRVRGVARFVADDPSGRTLLMALDRAPTDDELRTLHEYIAGRSPT